MRIGWIGTLLIFFITVPWLLNCNSSLGGASKGGNTKTGTSISLVSSSNKFMVAAAHPLATRAGYRILAQGGNAIDAAIAVQMVLNVVEPQSSGIGGGAFMLYWDAQLRKLTTFDGRETAPAESDTDYFLDELKRPKPFWKAVQGGGSVGVPGTLRMLELAHNIYGNLSFSSLFQPAIKIAEKGFKISPRLAASIKAAKKTGLARFKNTAEYFFDAQGLAKKADSLLKNHELAQTFRIIASKGVNAFYSGNIAEDIVAATRSTINNPGKMTLEDLQNYRAKIRPPVCINYRDNKVCGMGPPSSGGLTVAQILKMLEPFNLPKLGQSLRAAHLFVEASKLAYADRSMYMADRDFVSLPLDGLIDGGYLRERSQLIDINKAMIKATAGQPPWKKAQSLAPSDPLDRPGTSHFVIRDKMGNCVSMTTTIEMGFGSRVMVRGFLLNNELTDFSFRPVLDGKLVANRIEGGKRPRSSMAPTIVFKNDSPFLLTGSPGGSRIISYVAQTLIGILDWGLHPKSVFNMGHIVNRNGSTDLEVGTEAENLMEGLKTMGHETRIRVLNSGLHAILIKPNGTLVGAADPRREGFVMGN